MHSAIWPRLRQRLVELGDGTAVEESTSQGAATLVSARTLLCMAGQVAAELAALVPGAAPPIAGLFLTNSATYVAAVLGALQAGCAFLPLDPRWPRQRLQRVVSLAQAQAVLYAPEEVTGGHGRPPVEGCRMVRAPAAANGMTRPATSPPAQADELVPKEGEEQRLPYCYVMFTSGSTGAPLGVLGTEEGILNRCRWMEASGYLRARDRVAFKTSPCFVDSIWEVFGPLLVGARIIAVPQTAAANPAALCEAVARTGATHLAAVPAVWRALLQHLEGQGKAGGLSTLRLAVSSGEPLSAALLRRMQAALPGACRLLNLYGSTEVAADCTWLDCSARGGEAAAGGGHPGVGYPLAETLVTVMDPDEAAAGRWSLAKSGHVGEVFVAGSGLAAGYLAAPEETRRRFVSVPSDCLAAGTWGGAEGSSPAVRCFRTGDLGTLKGGCLFLKGRVDLQVKVAGVRVDLVEVEAVLATHPSVESAAAKVWPLPAGEALVGYVELSPGCPVVEASALEQELLAACRERLPRAAVPGRVLLLARLPRAAAGKVQRSALPRPDSTASPRNKRSFEETAEQETTSAGGAPGSQQPVSEVAISRSFARALEHKGFEPTQSLFSMGGTSLTAAQIASDLGIEVAALFQHPSVRSLAAYLRDGVPPGGAGATRAASATGSSEPRAQQGLAAGARPLLAGEPPEGGRMRLAWRARLLACIDAAPLGGTLDGRPCVFACSHAGDVGCFDAASGQRIWEATGWDRADAGLALCLDHVSLRKRTQYLAVGTNGGDLVFMDLARQLAWGRVPFGGALRAAPAVDPWPSCGLVWAVTHASELVIAVAPGQSLQVFALSCDNDHSDVGAAARVGRVVARRPLSSAASAPVAFDKERCLAYVACLDGTLMAISVCERLLGRLAASGRSAASDGSGWSNHMPDAVALAWQHQCSAALMAPPLVVTAAGEGVVLAAAVDGNLVALRSDGAVAWQASSLGSAVFSPMLLAAPGHVLVGTESGALYGVDAGSGDAAALCNLGSKVTGMAQPAPGQAVVCTAAGVVFWLEVPLLRQQAGPPAAAAVLDRVQLPQEVFAAPAVCGGRAWIGCRDDHLYCISLGS